MSIQLNVPLKLCTAHQLPCNICCPICLSKCVLCDESHGKINLESIIKAYQLYESLSNCPNHNELLYFYFRLFKQMLRRFCTLLIVNYKLKKCVIHYWLATNLTIYNPISSKKTVIKLDTPINPYADSISYYERIFIIGGKLISDTYEVNLIGKALIQKDSMMISKFCHSLCTSISYIFSLGGSNGNLLKECEKYNISTNKWSGLPSLNVFRNCGAAFSFNNQFVYSCCGCNGDALNLMERLGLNKYENWEMIKVINPLTETIGLHGVQINEKQAILFGGSVSGKAKKWCYIVNLCDDGVQPMKIDDLMDFSLFYCTSAPVVVDGVVYGVDELRRIHKWVDNMWLLII